VLQKTLFLPHHSLLELKEYQAPLLTAVASIFFADLDTTIQVLSFCQYHTASYYNSLEIHLNLLILYIFLDLEQFDQRLQVSSLFSFQSYLVLQT
jgi:hypothetical protein